MKILFVHNYYQQRGGEDVVFELERDLLRRNGHQVTDYCRNNSELKQLTVLGKIAAVKTTIWAGDSHRDLSSLLKRERYDVVHVHNTFVQISPSIYWACHEAGVPVVQTLHNYRLFCPSANLARESHVCRECIESGVWRGVWHGCYRGSRPATAGVALMLLVHRYCGTWMNCVDRYIALSHFSREQFVAAGLPAEKIRIKPNFVDPDPGCRTEALDYAVYIGRLSEEKGVDTLFSAMERLGGKVPLVVIGDGHLRGSLEARVRSAGLSASIQFRGWLERRHSMDLLKSARFLILPSECYETFGIVIAESYACGVPVIASKLGSLSEIVEDGETGLSFRPGDHAELAEKISWAWQNPELMLDMGLKARARYEANYSADRNYRLLIDIYEDAIASKVSPIQKSR